MSAVARTVPPVLSAAHLAQLERAGRVQAFNVMRAGATARVLYPDEGRLLVHRLGGIDLSDAQRIDLALHDVGGREVGGIENVPFDRERGEIVVACQRHFAEIFPRDVVFTVLSAGGERRDVLGRYTVEHRLQ